ncbi:MAG: helix-turn-helix domain-containing protein [Nitrospiria bacterium]
MELVTIKEVSQCLKVKVSTLYSWVYQGSIPFYKLNGLIRFNLEEINEWILRPKPGPQKRKVPLPSSKRLDIDDLVIKAIDDVKGKRL